MMKFILNDIMQKTIDFNDKKDMVKYIALGELGRCYDARERIF